MCRSKFCEFLKKGLVHCGHPVWKITISVIFLKDLKYVCNFFRTENLEIYWKKFYRKIIGGWKSAAYTKITAKHSGKNPRLKISKRWKYETESEEHLQQKNFWRNSQSVIIRYGLFFDCIFSNRSKFWKCALIPKWPKKIKTVQKCQSMSHHCLNKLCKNRYQLWNLFSSFSVIEHSFRHTLRHIPLFM